MAEKNRAEEEPSIEEILDSIRQIISEDDEAEAETDTADDGSFDEGFDAVIEEPTPAQVVAPEPIAVPEPEDDILVLTERVEDEPLPAMPAEEKSIVVDMVDEPPVVPQKVVEKPMTKAPEPIKELPPEDPEIDSILTQGAELAAFSAISELARKTAIGHAGMTIEEIVRSEIKPLLRGWLDKNLPIVIERLVREELERVTKRVLED